MNESVGFVSETGNVKVEVETFSVRRFSDRAPRRALPYLGGVRTQSEHFKGGVLVPLHTELLQSYPSPGKPGLGRLWFVLLHPLPSSAWADGKLPNVAEQVGNRIDGVTSQI